MSRLHTVAPCRDIAGLRIFALRGIVVEADRESLLSGLHAIVQEGRRNINGSKADIAMIIISVTVNSNLKGDCFSEGDPDPRFTRTRYLNVLKLGNIKYD